MLLHKNTYKRIIYGCASYSSVLIAYRTMDGREVVRPYIGIKTLSMAKIRWNSNLINFLWGRFSGLKFSLNTIFYFILNAETANRAHTIHSSAWKWSVQFVVFQCCSLCRVCACVCLKKWNKNSLDISSHSDRLFIKKLGKGDSL